MTKVEKGREYIYVDGSLQHTSTTVYYIDTDHRSGDDKSES